MACQRRTGIGWIAPRSLLSRLSAAISASLMSGNGICGFMRLGTLLFSW